MLKVLSKDNIDEAEKYLDQKIYSGFSIEGFIGSQADFHIIYEGEETILARCSVWFTHAPKGKDNIKIGTVGHFEAQNQESAQAVLEKACQLLKEKGCESVVGPMDGNTWRRYRFVTYSDGSAPFLLEPQNPAIYPDWFKAAGFCEESQYFSKRSQIPTNLEKCSNLLLDLEKQNITLRSVDMSNLDSELDKIYDISAVAFSNNLYYTEIDRIEFKKQYYAYKDYLVSELILLAFHNDKPIGFVFLIPDYNEMKTKGKVETIIAKTIAVLPEYRRIKLGSAMLKDAYRRSVKLGFKDVIVALVYDENVSANLIDKDFDHNRRYTLYIKNL